MPSHLARACFLLALLAGLVALSAAAAAPARRLPRAAGYGPVIAWGTSADGQTSPPALPTVLRIAAGARHALALRVDGTVAAWGDNANGQTAVPPGLSGVVQIAAGGAHSLALRADGTVAAWGRFAEGQCAVPPGLTGVMQIAAGSAHSLALKADGSVAAWGDNANGQTAVPAGLSGVVQIAAGPSYCLALRADGTVAAWGDSSGGVTSVPAGLTGVRQVAAGGAHSLALLADGTVVAWGDNSLGQCTPPSGLSGVVRVAAGATHSAALRADGTVVAWGDASQGGTAVPAGLSGVLDVAAGTSYTLVLQAASTARAWGYNGFGQTTLPAGTTRVKEVAAGAQHSLALLADGTARGWGYNGEGQASVPAGLSGAAQITAGAGHSVALRADGTLAAWGDNSLGQLLLPAGLAGVIQVAAGSYHTLALRADGTVLAWGDNAEGGTDVPPGLSGVRQVAAGAAHSLALRSDGTVVAWGRNTEGQCSVLPDLSGVVQVAAGLYHSLALKADGTVAAWGDNTFGQLSQAPALFGVRQVAAGEAHSLALRADGSIAAWGSNGSGQLAVPGGLRNVCQLAAGDLHSLAVAAPDTAPTLAPIPDAVTAEETPLALGLTVGDAESPAGSLVLSAASNNPALLPGAGLRFGGTGAQRTLTLTPAPDGVGSAAVSVTVNDGELTASRTFQLTVTPVNDPPGFVRGPDQTTTEGVALQTVPGWATALSPGPPDEAGQTLAFLVTNDQPALFAVQPAISPAGALTYRPAFAAGTATVTVRLKDSGSGANTSPPQTFRISVNLAAPTALAATPLFNRQVRLSWQDNSRNEDAYLVQRAQGSAFGRVELTTAVAANTFQDSGLAPATTYYYRVRALSIAAGYSAWADPASAATAAPPAGPTTLSAAPTSGISVRLAWADAPAETGYQLQRKPGAPTAGGTYTVLRSLPANTTTTTDTGLAPGQTYSYRILAYDAGDYSAPSAPAAVTLPLPPAAPAGVTARALSGTQAKVTWTAPAGNITAYRIERKEGSGAFAPVGQVSGSTLVFTNTALTPGVTYTFQVRAVSLGGVSNPGAAPPLTLPTCQVSPGGLALEAVSRTQVRVRWTYDGTDTARVSFVVERRPATETTYRAVVTVPPGTRAYLNGGLTAGETYCYRVRAINGAGTASPLTAVRLVTTPGP